MWFVSSTCSDIPVGQSGNLDQRGSVMEHFI